MPMGRLLAKRLVISSPSSRILPALGVSNPATMRSIVVLPHPLGPSKVKNSPCSTDKLISITAGERPKYLVICSSSRKATICTSFHRLLPVGARIILARFAVMDFKDLIILLLRFQACPHCRGSLVESAQEE